MRGFLGYSQVVMDQVRRKRLPGFRAKVVLELLRATRSVSELKRIRSHQHGRPYSSP